MVVASLSLSSTLKVDVAEKVVDLSEETKKLIRQSKEEELRNLPSYVSEVIEMVDNYNSIIKKSMNLVDEYSHKLRELINKGSKLYAVSNILYHIRLHGYNVIDAINGKTKIVGRLKYRGEIMNAWIFGEGTFRTRRKEEVAIKNAEKAYKELADSLIAKAEEADNKIEAYNLSMLKNSVLNEEKIRLFKVK